MSSTGNRFRDRPRGSFWHSQAWAALQVAGLLLGAAVALTLVLLALRH
jgi:hypothetical protein